MIQLVAGELPSEEAAALRAWVAEDSERQEFLAHLEAVWQVTALPEPLQPGAWDAEAELRRIRQATGGTGRVIARVGGGADVDRRPRRSRVGLATRIAAAVALAIGGGVLWHMSTLGGPTAASPTAMKEYRTAPGERLSLGLPDGARVVLAPGSVLRRPLSYGFRDRTVYLDGQAYFYVPHDAAHPFAVHTRRAVVRDLGTEFVVRAYADEATTDVVVSEGLVALRRADVSADSVLLRPRDRATILAGGTLAVSRALSPEALEPYTGWTSGQLVFARVPLRDVARELERWYGIQVRIADSSLSDARLTATFREEGATEALDVVATSLDLVVSRVGRTYVFGRARR